MLTNIIGCDEDEQDADDQTIKTGGFRDGTTQNHGRSYVAFALGLATDGFAGFGGSVAFTDTRADTCNQGKAGANARSPARMIPMASSSMSESSLNVVIVYAVCKAFLRFALRRSYSSCGKPVDM